MVHHKNLFTIAVNEAESRDIIKKEHFTSTNRKALPRDVLNATNNPILPLIMSSHDSLDPLMSFQVQVPGPTLSSMNNINPEIPAIRDGTSLVRAIFKYHNGKGREAILATAKIVHHDFGLHNGTMAVSLASSDLEVLKSDPNVECFEGDGRVIYCSIR